MDISVIITSYNEARYVSTAIESVIKQSKIPNELILVDGGSTDGTRSILSQYENDYPFIKSEIIDEKVNIPEMRNVALKKAKGPLVTFLDGDDRFRPKKLEEEYETYTSCSESNIVFSNVCNINPAGNVLNIWFENEHPPTGDILAENASRSWPTGSLYRNELISLDLLYEVGMYDENLKVYEDWDLKIRTAAKAEATYCPKVLTEYRQHDSGISSRIRRSELRDASKYIYNKNKQLLEKNLEQSRYSDVIQSMEKHILEHSIRAAKEERNYYSMLANYNTWVMKSGDDKFNLRKHASLLLPEYIKSHLR